MGNLNLVSPAERKKREWRVVILGSQAVGKTSILYRLKSNSILATIPTIGFNVETILYKDSEITIWEIGGGSKMPYLWIHYLQNTDAIIYVVDASLKECVVEAKEYLFSHILAYVKPTESSSNGMSLLILANKQDVPGALTCEEVYDRLDLKSYPIPFNMLPRSALDDTGMQKIRDSLYHQILYTKALNKGYTIGGEI